MTNPKGRRRLDAPFKRPFWKLARKAGQMRRQMTLAEKVLWEAIRNDKLGVRFWRQRVLRGYIVDFYAGQINLVIEVDGGSHQWTGERDAIRDRWLALNGFRIVRLSNSEVLNNLPQAVHRIKTAISGPAVIPYERNRLQPSRYCD